MHDYYLMAKELCMSLAGKGGQQAIELIESGYRGEFVALRILRDNISPMLAGELAVKMNVSTARVAALIKALAGKKYLQYAKVQGDGRKVALSLTQQGLKVLEEREYKVYSFAETALRKLEPEEAARFIATAKKLFG